MVPPTTTQTMVLLMKPPGAARLTKLDHLPGNAWRGMECIDSRY